MKIITSTILHQPKIIWTILKNIPTLDPLVIIKNAKVFVGYEGKDIVGFLSIKQFGDITELGTLYVYPEFRRRGYAEQLYQEARKEYSEIYLLCTPKMSEVYNRYDFSVIDEPTGTLRFRKKLFDMFIAPFVGYRIVVMKSNQIL